MLIMALLGAAVALSAGCAVALLACAIDTRLCHRRSRLVGHPRPARAR